MMAEDGRWKVLWGFFLLLKGDFLSTLQWRWDILKEVDNTWSMKNNYGTTSEEQEIANLFINYFTTKISSLKEKIDDKYKEDPLAKLKNMKNQLVWSLWK